ncbi:hypothetical protein GH714_022700 [Hevea brasiliensis]|uniref:Uncharacterized protein n=1 Tax=Hevea brasiliensis TaxID=3981 RepID=A0A6A6LZU5_HEVBR|nr:hypothetical protein GH714_022700 [Hevea brasiliensis]
MASLLSLSIPKPSIIKATSSSTATTTTLPTLEILEEKFGRKGIKFSESNNIPVVELTVRNGSSLRLWIPDAHVTSYKPKVYWKDEGFEELLYTIPGKESSKARGGVGLVINDASEAGSKESLITSSQWTVKDVDSDAIDALQRRGKAAIQGFKGCSYCPFPPLPSPFEILSPGEAMKSESSGLFDFGLETEDKPGTWTVQDVPFSILKNKFSRVYAAPPQERLKPIYNTPPSKYETLDQGLELFFRVIRMGGFEDTYIGSPGSLSEKYGQEYFICSGPAAMLVPVFVEPGEDWRGEQVIEHDNFNKKREFPIPSVASIPYEPINVDYLEEEFSGHGVTFEDIGDSYIAKMKLENGSAATLMLPSGLITSYKAHMWHGGTVELLQTTVSKGEDGNPVIQGGVSLAFNFGSDGETLWSPSTWAVHAIRGSPQDSIQVTVSTNQIIDPVDGIPYNHLTVSHQKRLMLWFLEGSNFFNRPMFLSNLSIVPPDLGPESRDGSGKPRDIVRLKGSGWGARDQKNSDKRNIRQIESEKEMEGEESDSYKHLTEEMSRIYTNAPRDFTIIDRGRRNSVVIARDGFEELYMFSPGSIHESFGMYSFICVGQSAMLKPVILRPGEIWTGGQHLHNPNL